MLSDIEITKIENFCNDEQTFNAVKKVVLAMLYDDGVITSATKAKVTNGAFNQIAGAYQNSRAVSNDELGQQLRGLYEGAHLLESGFAKLKTIKKEAKGEESPYNEAV